MKTDVFEETKVRPSCLPVQIRKAFQNYRCEKLIPEKLNLPIYFEIKVETELISSTEVISSV